MALNGPLCSLPAANLDGLTTCLVARTSDDFAPVYYVVVVAAKQRRTAEDPLPYFWKIVPGC